MQDSKLTAKLILDSYQHWTGKKLIEGGAEELFYSSIVVVSHNADPDPLLQYANKAALKLWELTAEELIKTPSRETAELEAREERLKLLQEVSKNGYSNNYSGIRISKTGKRFQIKNATVWNLLEQQGQAACFRDWSYL